MTRLEMVMQNFDKYADYMNDRVKTGIEENRKSFAYLTIKDADGKPVKGAKIKAVQKSHDFKFGANLFMLDELETEEKNELYKKHFRETFNMATIPFYWNTLEPEQGKTRYDKNSPKVYRRPSPDLCMEFCEQNGIEPREHALAYEHHFPEWLRGKSDREVKFLLEKRYAENAERYAHRIPTIEVTNEMFHGPHMQITDFYRAPDFIEWCFKTAEKHFPANQLVINEITNVFDDPCGPTSYYYSIIANALAKGARIDAVGMQWHMFDKRDNEENRVARYFNPLFLYNTLDTYATLGKPLQITEVTLSALSNEAADEEVQAKLLDKLYRIWFSHKNVEQIIYWNLPDGYAHKAEPGDMSVGENQYYGGLLRFDMSPKPAFHTLKNLIEKEWHTETEIITNEGGIACFKGFHGKYDVTVVADGKEIKKEIHLEDRKLKRPNLNESEIIL